MTPPPASPDDNAPAGPGQDTSGAARGELQSLERGIRILDLFLDGNPEARRVADVTAALNIPTSTAYRLIRVLKSNGLLQDGDARGSFELGDKLRLLGDCVRGEDGLLARIRPVLEGLRRTTAETVMLTIRSGDEAVHAEVLESEQELRVSIPRGRRMHIAAGGSGRVILAHLRDTEIDRVLSQPVTAYTPQTVTDPELIRAELAQIRDRGYAISESQTTAQTRGICMPLLSAGGMPLGSLTVTGPAFRMDAERTEMCVSAMRDAIAGLAL